MKARNYWACTASVMASFGCSGETDTARPPDTGQNHVVQSSISCDSCRIVLDTIAILRGVDPVPGTFALSKQQGDIYLVDRSDNRVKSFDRNGRMVNAFGRRGGGPGEYEQISSLVVAADGNVHVLDGVLGRHTVFSPAGRLLGTSHVDIGPGIMTPAVLQASGRLVVNTSNAASSSEANTLKLIDTSGSVIHSTAPVEPGTETHSWHRARVLWLRSGDEVLVARRFSPVVTVYSPDLIPKDSIRREMDWFPMPEPDAEPADGVFDKPLTARVNALWEDSTGRLWLHFLAASPRWRPKTRPSDFKPEDYLTFGARPRARSIVEVLDPDLRRVLARADFEGGLGETFGDGLVADYMAKDAAGEPAIRILRLSFAQ